MMRAVYNRMPAINHSQIVFYSQIDARHICLSMPKFGGGLIIAICAFITFQTPWHKSYFNWFFWGVRVLCATLRAFVKFIKGKKSG